MSNRDFDDLEWDYNDNQIDALEWEKDDFTVDIESSTKAPIVSKNVENTEITQNTETTFDVSKREVEADVKYSREKTREALDTGLAILKNLSLSESADIKGVSMLLKEIIEGNRQLLGIHQQKDTILSDNHKQLEMPGGVSTSINKAIIFQGNSTQFDELIESYKKSEE